MLALLYDVHGNRPALDAVLADAHAAGADRHLLGGDYCGLGAWPGETLEQLNGLPSAVWIRGNWERWTASPGDAPGDETVTRALEWVRAQLDPATVAELAALPDTTAKDGVRYCHASPLGDMRGFATKAGADDAELIAGVEEARVVVGHTHIQFRRHAGERIELVNPGSVGLPFDGDTRAAYALVTDEGWIELRRVAYDHQASADAARERLGDWAEAVARRIERARFDA